MFRSGSSRSEWEASRDGINEEAYEMTRERGVECLRVCREEGKTLYVFSAPRVPRVNAKVGSAVWVYEGRGLLHAFTTGALAYDDNFDRSPGSLHWAVENFTFGYGKLKCEEEVLRRMLDDPYETLSQIRAHNMRAPKTDRNFLQNVDSVLQCMDSTGKQLQCPLFAPFFIDMLKQGLRDTVLACAKNGAKEAIFLQIYPQLKASADAFEGRDFGTPAEALDAFLRVKDIIAQRIPQLTPKVAKMGLGRCTLFNCMGAQWEGDALRLHMWSVCFMRVFLLLNAPLSAYVFYMTNAFGKSDEFSKHDNLWAHQRKSAKLTEDHDPGALCDLESYSTDIRWDCDRSIQKVMCHTVPLPNFLGHGVPENQVDSNYRKLGVANSWVIYFLMEAAGGPSVEKQMPRALYEQMMSAKNYLVNCGWAAGVDAFSATRSVGLYAAAPNSVFYIQKLPDKYAIAIRTATLKDAEQFIEAMAKELPQ